MNKDDFKNLPIGSVFEFENEKLRVQEDYGVCDGCFMLHTSLDCESLIGIKIPECGSSLRKDGRSVIFMEDDL